MAAGSGSGEADDTPNRLLAAAGEIFGSKGFHGATVREICDAAGANVAAVNYHFGGKERLYIEAVKASYCLAGAATAYDDLHLLASPQLRLREFIRRFLAHLLDRNKPEWHARLMLRELAEPTQACTEVVESFIRPMSRQLRAVLEPLLPPGTSNEKTMLTCFSVVGQCLFYKVNKPIVSLLLGQEHYDRLDPDRLADHIAGFSLAALGAYGQAGPATAGAAAEGGRR